MGGPLGQHRRLRKGELGMRLVRAPGGVHGA